MKAILNPPLKTGCTKGPAALGVLFPILAFLSVCVCALVFFSCSTPAPVSEAYLEKSIHSELTESEKHLKAGEGFFNGGDFKQAISSWNETLQLVEKSNDISGQVNARIKLSQAYHAIGHLNASLENLKTALKLAEASDQREKIPAIRGYLGNTYIGLGHMDIAHQHLTEGHRMAQEQGNEALESTILNNLGNLYTSTRRFDEALDAYRKSGTLSIKTENYLLAATAMTNGAMTSIRRSNFEPASLLLDSAIENIGKAKTSYFKIYGLINIGLAHRELGKRLTNQKKVYQKKAFETLGMAAEISETVNDPRMRSYALGYLGRLYEDQNQIESALQLTRRAVFSAQQGNAPESLYRWHWQAGRLLKALGSIDEAIVSYKHAVYTLHTIRQELSTCYANPESSFRGAAASVCFELVDLLLQHASHLKVPEEYESVLKETREVVELLKVFELREYFKDDCVDATRLSAIKLDAISKKAIVVYPIILRDRLELLVSLPSGLRRFSVPVGADTLTMEVRKFRRKLEKRTTGEYLPHAQQLYNWLIHPFKPELARIDIDTIIFVPDGPLRTIPMAALHEGAKFLIQDYAVAVTPGLDLADPRPIERKRMQVLAMGLTESVQGFPSLPYVSRELDAIQNLYGADRLINNDFIFSNMEGQLKQEQFNIVHIASHGKFGTNVEDTFILSFDEKLTMDRLGDFVGIFQFHEDPLELITLSACETAAGDDRAALGLAGIAVRTGARSALATLWHINDPATSNLVTEFYRQLQNPSISRAEALQSAQIKMLEDPRYDHPGYWSPFLLINNWL